MIKAALTKAIKLGESYEREIAIASGAWFCISCASWVPFLPIPSIPYLTDSNSWVFSGAWNAIWWGLVHPALEKRREEMRQETEVSSQEPTARR